MWMRDNMEDIEVMYSLKSWSLRAIITASFFQPLYQSLIAAPIRSSPSELNLRRTIRSIESHLHIEDAPIETKIRGFKNMYKRKIYRYRQNKPQAIIQNRSAFRLSFETILYKLRHGNCSSDRLTTGQK